MSLLFLWLKVRVAQSCPTLSDPMDYILQAGTLEWVATLSLLQRIFPTQGSNPGLPHCRRILYQLSHKGSPRILEWVAYPFSSGSSRPRNWTRVSCIAGRFFTNWANFLWLAFNIFSLSLVQSFIIVYSWWICFYSSFLECYMYLQFKDFLIT